MFEFRVPWNKWPRGAVSRWEDVRAQSSTGCNLYTSLTQVEGESHLQRHHLGGLKSVDAEGGGINNAQARLLTGALRIQGL